MFDSLTSRLSETFDRLRGRGALTESDVDEALREIRDSLIEADVALPVVKDFIAAIRDKAQGEEVIGSLTPGQALVGVVARELTALMGGAGAPLNFATQPPAVILLAGRIASVSTKSSSGRQLPLNRVRAEQVRRCLDRRLPRHLVGVAGCALGRRFQRLDRVEIDVREAVALLLVVGDPHALSLEPRQLRGDLLLEGGVLLALVVDEDEARVAGPRLEGLDVAHADLGLGHAARVPVCEDCRHAGSEARLSVVRRAAVS